MIDITENETKIKWIDLIDRTRRDYELMTLKKEELDKIETSSEKEKLQLEIDQELVNHYLQYCDKYITFFAGKDYSMENYEELVWYYNKGGTRTDKEIYIHSGKYSLVEKEISSKSTVFFFSVLTAYAYLPIILGCICGGIAGAFVFCLVLAWAMPVGLPVWLITTYYLTSKYSDYLTNRDPEYSRFSKDVDTRLSTAIKKGLIINMLSSLSIRSKYSYYHKRLY